MWCVCCISATVSERKSRPEPRARQAAGTAIAVSEPAVRSDDTRSYDLRLIEAGIVSTEPARRMSEAQIRHPEGINRIWYQALFDARTRRSSQAPPEGLQPVPRRNRLRSGPITEARKSRQTRSWET